MTFRSKVVTLAFVWAGVLLVAVGALAPSAPAVKPAAAVASSTSVPVPVATEHPAPVEQPAPEIVATPQVAVASSVRPRATNPPAASAPRVEAPAPYCASYCGEPPMLLGCPSGTTSTDLATLACSPSGVVGYIAWHRPGQPYEPYPARPANPCPVQSWVLVERTLAHDVPSYGATTASASRLGTIPAGTTIHGCHRPDGWIAATGYGWVRGSDL